MIVCVTFWYQIELLPKVPESYIQYCIVGLLKLSGVVLPSDS